MNRTACTIGLVLIALMARGVSAEEKTAESIAVRIVPTSTHDKGGRSITLWQPSHHFHVVITNLSKEPIRLWREWCSWGYYSLSFALADAGGKITIVKKGPMEWAKNYPDATTLAPGDHMVFEVTFDQSTWPNAPVPDKGKSREIKMKAVFSIPADEDTKKQSVWTGEVSSPEDTYTIYR